ncbi:MAG TPA: hypothetical protein VEC12_08160 [Bacteroidia bacterium]|nr:hypothetical protein [Bacteroidia bacterium]
MRVSIAVILVAAGLFTARAQAVQQVFFDETAYDERYHKSKLVVPLFRYVSSEIEEYEQFGIENKKGPDKFTLKKLPDMTGCSDTAYGFIYYSGSPSTINRGYITILVGNYRRGTKPAIIYTDANNNLDFTDDGIPDTIDLFTHTKDIKIKNPAAEGAFYIVRLSRYTMAKDLKYQDMLDDYYRKNQGSKEFVGSYYSFKENRVNMKGATYKGETDTFRIALYDGNYDGLYTNAEFDRVMLAKAGDSIFLDDFRFNFQDDLKNAEFEWNYKVYRITEIDPSGRFIKFYWDKNAVSKRAVQVGKKLPKFEFYLEDSKTTKKIRKYRKKGLYVYFYNLDSPTFEQDTAILHRIQTRFGNCINVLTLNYGDYYKTVSILKTRDKVPYITGLSTRKINRLFTIEKLPAGFLCRKKLRVSHINITPAQVLELLEKESRKE